MIKTKTNRLLLSVVLVAGLVLSALVLTGCSQAMSEDEYKDYVSEKSIEFSRKWSTRDMQSALKNAMQGDKVELTELVSDIRGFSDSFKNINPPAKYQEHNKEVIDIFNQLADMVETAGNLSSSSSYTEQKEILDQINDVIKKLSDFQEKYSELY